MQWAKEHSLARAAVNGLEGLEHELLEVRKGSGGKWQGAQRGVPRSRGGQAPRGWDVCRGTALGHLEAAVEQEVTVHRVYIVRAEMQD